MKKTNWLYLILLLAMSCQDFQFSGDENISPDSNSFSTSTSRSIAVNGVNCNEIKTIPLTVNGAQAGTVNISVQEAQITVTYNLVNSPWFLLSAGVFVGDCNSAPGSMYFPITQSFTLDSEVRSYTFTVPFDQLPSCGCISVTAKVARYNPISSQIESFQADAGTEYCNCEQPESPVDTVICPITKDFSVTGAQGVEVGKVNVGLDQTSINVDYNLAQGEWFLLKITAVAGICDGMSDPSDYTYTQSFTIDSETRSSSFAIPLDALPDCGCMITTATVGRYNPATSQIETYNSKVSAAYCKCEEQEEEPDDKNLRTQTPGGWGAPPRGNNPGAYLHANFASAFPSGLEVGCNYTITLTSAQAITDFLPQGGTPSSLKTSFIDPAGSGKSNNPKNVLAGHVVALTLSVTFDVWDEDFGESNTSLANAVITSGQFEGWTVADALAEAEKVLGGCTSNYSASELTEVLSAINESFVDGTTNTGFLQNQ